MQKSERTDFIELIVTLAEMFDRQLSDAVADLYLNALQDLTIDELRRACDSASRECKFFPKPVELRELVRDSATERGERAWVLLLEACDKSGDCSVFFEDNNLAQAMLAMFGGWVAAYESLVHLSPEMMAAKRKEFLTVYRMVEKRVSDTDVRLQPGRHELSNRESHGQWAHKWIEAGRTVYNQQVVVVRDSVKVIVTSYDTQTGQMSGVSWQQLTEGTEPKQLLARPAPLMIEAAIGEPMTREEFQQGIKEFTRRGMHVVAKESA